MSECKLAIIGAGNIGSRHLQALALIDRPATIEVVDSSPASLNQSKKRFSQVCGAGNVRSVAYLDKISNLSSELDVVVVATTADVRRLVIEELLSQKQTRYLILEKVLFQRREDFSLTKTLLTQHSVSAWVNCQLRLWPFYQYLRSRFKGSQKIEYSVSGSQLGIGSNSIHYLDHLAYLTNETEFTIFSNHLDSIIASKRAGFVEFTGTLCGVSARKDRISITSYAEGDIPELIQIMSDKVRCVIRLTENKAWISDGDTDWQWREVSFATPYISNLTHLAVQQLLDHGECDLPTYAESCKLHLPVLEALTSYLERQRSETVDVCPIT